MQELLKALREGVCFVTYQKLDTGDLREMECTLNPDLIPRNFEVNQRVGDDIVVWCIDKNDWRSFRVNTMKNWRVK